MKIEIRKENNEATILVAGILDASTAPALSRTIKASAKSTPSIILDLNGVEHISSEGLSVILGARKRMKGMGSLRLTGVCESVIEAIEATAN